MTISLRKLVVAMSLGLMFCATGCATFHMPFGKERIQKASARNPVMQIICIWQPSEGRDPNGVPCRGFAGQILFLAGRNSMPVQVEGDVRIYLFDDKGSEEDQAKPIHQYDFDAGSWDRHLTKGTLGPTYSVFVPYTRRGTHEAKCALRLRLKTDDQPAVFSDMATIPLDGKTKKESDTGEQLPSADEAQAALDAVSKTMRRTTTISMNGETSKPNAKSNPVQTAALSVRADEAVGRVQLANFEEGSEPTDPSTQRIEQLEQLVQQLLQTQSGAATERTKPAIRRVQPAPAVAPARLAADAARHPLSDDEDDAPQPIRLNARPRREAAATHPLAEFDDELSREASSLPKSNHLEGRQPDLPQESAVRETRRPTTRTILATESPSHETRSWTDPG